MNFESFAIFLSWAAFFCIGGLIGSMFPSKKKIHKFIVVDKHKAIEGPTVTQICKDLKCKSIKVSYDFGKTYTKYKAKLDNEGTVIHIP